MGKKYIANDFDFLGKMYDTPEDAERAARGIDFKLDALTGWSSAFNEEVYKSADVTEIDDGPISAEQFVAMKAEYQEAKKALEKEIQALRRKRLGKYWTLETAYINLNTEYEYWDVIRLTTLRKSGRKRILKGRVYGVSVENNGEIRPCLRGKENYYPRDEKILKIEVLEKFDFREVKQRVVCKNCKFFTLDEGGSVWGQCSHFNKRLYYYNDNCEEYVRDPEKKN